MPQVNVARIVERRRALNWSQQDLAEAAGVSQQQISILETDPAANPKIGSLWRIAHALDLKLSDLILTPVAA